MNGPAVRRARRWFWGLAGLAVLLTGGLSRALQAAPGPRAGALVAGLGLALAAVVALDARLLVVLAPRRPRPSRGRRPRR